jgi:hypothetical protein
VRIPGVCNWNPETTVLAHIGGAGMGMKADDIHGAHCCSSCHDAIDGRVQTDYSNDELELMHLQGVIRTQRIWRKEGLL